MAERIEMKARHDADSLTANMRYAPIVATAGTNLYAWCGNNPVNMVDPMGTFSVKDILRRGAQTVRSVARGIGAGYYGSQSGGGGAYGLGYRIGSGARAGAKKVAAVAEAVKPAAKLLAPAVKAMAQVIQAQSQYAARSSASVNIDTKQMFSGGVMGNLRENCDYYTNQEYATGSSIYVSDALKGVDWEMVWQKEQDWVGRQATITSFSGGASMITGKLIGPWGMSAFAVGHLAWATGTSETVNPQDVRDFCNYWQTPGNFYLQGPH